MTTKTPAPRSSNYLGLRSQPHVCDDGTWLEPEELCYPTGGMLRRAYATCGDGQKRVIRCGIPDTFFSIPGYYRKEGKRVRGFISSGDGGYIFTELKK